MKVNWYLTNELRWNEKSVPFENSKYIRRVQRVLQQKFLSRNGATKWIDIPIIK